MKMNQRVEDPWVKKITNVLPIVPDTGLIKVNIIPVSMIVR